MGRAPSRGAGDGHRAGGRGIRGHFRFQHGGRGNAVVHDRAGHAEARLRAAARARGRGDLGHACDADPAIHRVDPLWTHRQRERRQTADRGRHPGPHRHRGDHADGAVPGLAQSRGRAAGPGIPDPREAAHAEGRRPDGAPVRVRDRRHLYGRGNAHRSFGARRAWCTAAGGSCGEAHAAHRESGAGQGDTLDVHGADDHPGCDDLRLLPRVDAGDARDSSNGSGRSRCRRGS